MLQDDDAPGTLLQSLDQAGEIWTRTQRQNQLALRQLQRQVRIGESRQAPHIVLITFEHSGEKDSPRGQLFKKLGERSVSFAQHYAGGESADSGWWSLMTGRPASRASAAKSRFQLRQSDNTIASCLWKAGYSTAFFGIWSGQASPLQCGFEEWTGLQSGRDEITQYPHRLTTGRHQMTVAANADGRQEVSIWKLLEIEIASFLSSQQSSSQPMFLQIRLPELDATSSEETAESVVDHLVDELERHSLTARTCVFVTTLAGPQSVNALSERALRVPLVMVGGHPENTGRVVQSVTAAWDLCPTLMDIARASQPSPARDGRSLVQKSVQRPWEEERLLYWEADERNGAQSVRRGEWFGTVAPGTRPLQLFHLPTDPQLKNDVAKVHPDVVQQLLAPADDAATR
jgi:arylsulfatase A-like enzyme